MISKQYEFIRKPNGLMIAVPLQQAAPASAAPPVATAEASPAPKPSGFADRLKVIMALPEAFTRKRQAVAIAAETSCSVKEAKAILARLPSDAERSFPHGGTMFPKATVQHDAAAQRIIAIMHSGEAEGLDDAALELATGTALALDQVKVLLSQMPKPKAVERIPTIAERAAKLEEIGGNPLPMEDALPSRAGRSKAVWEKAVAEVNAKTMAQYAPQAAPQDMARDTERGNSKRV